MSTGPRPVSVADASAALLRVAHPQPPLRVPLAQSLDHVLAESVHAASPLPPWTSASMDGFAVRADDVRGATVHQPIRLPLAGSTAAGDATPPPLAPGAAWRVATGGAVPAGADSVIRQEHTVREGALVRIDSDLDANQHVRPAGGDLAPGDLALAHGQRIGPAQIGLLAALGITHPVVHRRPRIGVLVSGNELVPVDHGEMLARGDRLVDVNSPMLASAISRAGGIPVLHGIAADDPGQILAAVQAASDIDMLITAGGISVGEQDHILAVMAAANAEVVFRRVRIRPGGPTTLATLPDGRPWLALPGNPVSALVTFVVFGVPAVRSMMGDLSPVTPRERAMLSTPVAQHPTLDQYLRVTLEADRDGGTPRATLTGPQGSWVLTSIAKADGVVIIPAGTGDVSGIVDMLPIGPPQRGIDPTSPPLPHPAKFLP